MKLFSAAVLSLVVLLPLSVAHAATPKSGSSYGGAAEVSVTGSAGSIDGNIAIGPGLQFTWPLTLQGTPFQIGGQTGFYYTWDSAHVYGVQATSKAWALPFLASGKYLIPSDISFIKPYFGLALGFSLDHEFGNANDGNGNVVSRSETDLHFAFLIRPGMTFGDTQHWFAEIPFGVLLTDFTIMPTIGYHF